MFLDPGKPLCWGTPLFHGSHLHYITRDRVLVTIKDIFYVLEGSELSNGFPGVAHHVVDDLWLYGVTVFTYFQLWLVLEVKTGHTSMTVNKTTKHSFYTVPLNYTGMWDVQCFSVSNLKNGPSMSLLTKICMLLNSVFFFLVHFALFSPLHNK